MQTHERDVTALKRRIFVPNTTSPLRGSAGASALAVVSDKSWTGVTSRDRRVT